METVTCVKGQWHKNSDEHMSGINVVLNAMKGKINVWMVCDSVLIFKYMSRKAVAEAYGSINALRGRLLIL